jgi:hypothetical protein
MHPVSEQRIVGDRRYSPDASTEPKSTLRDSHRPGMSAVTGQIVRRHVLEAVAAEQKIMVSAVFKEMTSRVHCE